MRINIDTMCSDLEVAYRSYHLANQMAAIHAKRAMVARFQYIDGTVYSLSSVIYNSNMAERYAKNAMDARNTIIKFNSLDTKTLVRYEVEQAEYMGEGYWADYPPLEFATLEEALEYATLIDACQQTGSNTKVRGVFAVYE